MAGVVVDTDEDAAKQEDTEVLHYAGGRFLCGGSRRAEAAALDIERPFGTTNRWRLEGESQRDFGWVAPRL
jgi:hypothetical protein